MKHLIFYSLLLLLFSCGPKKNMVYMEQERSPELSAAVFEGSRLQAGDLLDIKVTAYDEYAVRPFNLHTMNQSTNPSANMPVQTAPGSTPQGYLVENDGSIVFPVLGRLQVQGLTRDQLRADLEQRLLRYLSDPIVTIRQLNFNITVLGEVKKPGQYTSPTDKVTLFQALGMAGDMTDNGDRTQVRLLRNVEGKEQSYLIDFTDANITASPFYYLQQNDVLYVQPDSNKKIAANVYPNSGLLISLAGVVIAVITLIVRN